MHDFETVFDLTQTGYTTWWGPAVGCAMLVKILTLLISPASTDGSMPSDRGSKWFYAFLAAFATLWTVLAAAGTYGEYLNLLADIDAGHVGAVTGPVQNFNIGSQSRVSFQVADTRFQYSPYVATNAFNGFLIASNPFQDGRCVRITFVKELGLGSPQEQPAIIKIEVDKKRTPHANRHASEAEDLAAARGLRRGLAVVGETSQKSIRRLLSATRDKTCTRVAWHSSQSRFSRRRPSQIR